MQHPLYSLMLADNIVYSRWGWLSWSLEIVIFNHSIHFYENFKYFKNISLSPFFFVLLMQLLLHYFLIYSFISDNLWSSLLITRCSFPLKYNWIFIKIGSLEKERKISRTFSNFLPPSLPLLVVFIDTITSWEWITSSKMTPIVFREIVNHIHHFPRKKWLYEGWLQTLPSCKAGFSRSSSTQCALFIFYFAFMFPGSGRFPGEGNGNPIQYTCLENSMDWGA